VILLHLIEPASWRSALTRGAVRPPSLEALGFVHLSSPEQVHLPAEALFPGRRDLVLLVVDPGRLTDPVRWEPGTPSDPDGMRFPHLYGPLPVAAVIAVVPYRPPTVPTLPAPDDPAGRALALHGSVPVRRAAEVRDVPGGVAVLDPRFRHSRDDNRLLLTSPVDADTVERTASALADEAGWPHLAASLAWPGLRTSRGSWPAATGRRANSCSWPAPQPRWTAVRAPRWPTSARCTTCGTGPGAGCSTAGCTTSTRSSAS
jgi:uncharacterized protein (DUF952 family)